MGSRQQFWSLINSKIGTTDLAGLINDFARDQKLFDEYRDVFQACAEAEATLNDDPDLTTSYSEPYYYKFGPIQPFVDFAGHPPSDS